MTICRGCSGVGLVHCEECDGASDFSEHFCKGCANTSMMECPSCDGSGRESEGSGYSNMEWEKQEREADNLAMTVTALVWLTVAGTIALALCYQPMA